MAYLESEHHKIIRKYLEGWKPKVRLGKECDTERFVNAVFWICYSGSQWRELPDEYGHWNTVYKRFSDWGELGIWQGLLKHLNEKDIDLEYVMIDSTVIRAHACCSTGKKKRRNQKKD